MTTYKWTPTEEHLCRILYCGGMTQQKIADEITTNFQNGVKGFPSARIREAVKDKIAREGWTRDDKYTETNNPIATQFNLIEAIVEKHKENCVENTRGIMSPDKITSKILSLSDIHFPFTNTKFLAQAIREHKDANIVVLNGDIIEGYLFSTFEKSRIIAAVEEYRAAFAFIEFLSKNFKTVVIVSGNHDVRAARALKESGLHKEASQIFRPDLLARMVNGEELNAHGALIKKHDFRNIIYQQAESWYVKIGKTIFAHPHGAGGGAPGAVAQKQCQRFNLRYNADEFDSLVVGHVHKIYKGVINNQLLIEQGCLAGFMHYAWKPEAKYINSAQNGYAVIYQDKDGNTDFNRSGPIYLGEMLPAKKDAIKI